MLFNSVNFLLFFPVVLIMYFLVPVRYRYLWLLISSYLFYASFGYKCLFVLLGITVISYMGGILLDSERIKGRPAARYVFAFSILMCLFVLGAFKYLDFIVSNVDVVLADFGMRLLPTGFSFFMPVGVSFYTFKSIGYLADVYRGRVLKENNFLKYALFVAFFPQLVAGPIDRAGNLLTQINENPHSEESGLRHGIMLMLWGYFEKMLIADRIGVLVDSVYNNYASYSGAVIAAATVFYGIQIYADFSGYSHLAVGISEILGYKVNDNFRQPYFAMGIRDFWSRWHISMSAWFRDYVYIPLGGNRKGDLRKVINNMITFLLSGLWHGASWNYIVWGGIHGIYQVGEAFLRRLKNRYPVLDIKGRDRHTIGYRLFWVIATFVLVDFAWLFFRADSIASAIDMMRRIMTDTRLYTLSGDWIYDLGLSETAVRTILPGCLALAVVDVLHENGVSITKWLDRQGVIFRCICYVSSVLFILLVAVQNLGQSTGTFIYSGY